MGTPMIGMNAILGLAEQTLYDTPVTADHWLPILSHSLQADQDIRPVPWLGVANNQAYHASRDSVEVARTAGGGIQTCAMYDDKAFLLMLKHAMGAVSTTGPSSTQYTHTFGLDTDAMKAGLTGKAILGSQQTNRMEIFTGVRINTMTLSVDAGGWMTAAFDTIIRSSAGLAAISGTPAYTAAELVLGHQGSTFDWNSHTETMRSMRVTLNNNLIRRPYIGGIHTDEPAPGGPASVEFEATFPWESSNLYDDFRAKVQDDATVTFTGTGDNQMAIGLYNLKIFGVSKPIDRAGELTYTVRGQAFDLPGTNQALGIVVKNSNSTAI